MTQYFREIFFKNIAANMPMNEQQRLYSEPEYAPFDVFLSYNISDKEVVKGVYYYLTNQGFKVYLDFIIDKDLDRSRVDKNSAERIQKRLRNSKSLIYAQSPNAAMSKWMPWELGSVDGHTQKCFVLPVCNSVDYSYTRQEYLLLYPIIKLDDLDRMKVYESETAIYGKSVSDIIR